MSIYLLKRSLSRKGVIAVKSRNTVKHQFKKSTDFKNVVQCFSDNTANTMRTIWDRVWGYIHAGG